ncbi:MAG TPA: LacI family transcriptional regulator [Firmicutes bacterium]|nr:LacI family transcriptional regulator [Bacillota bacterium]
MRRVTQSDVAKRAGVSRSTVSLVLNRNSDVVISEETRNRVFNAAMELGYTPNLAAQKLAGGRNNLIGVFIYRESFPYEQDSFYYAFLLGIERQASEEGYDLLMFTRHDRHGNQSIYRDGANILTMVDGAVLMGAETNKEEIRAAVKDGHKIVYIGRRNVPDCQLDWVSSDYRTVSGEAMKHLLDLGHRQIGYTAPVGDYEPDLDRIVGCEEVIAKNPAAQMHMIPVEVWNDPRELAAFIRQKGLTALILSMGKCADLVENLQHADLRVPEDLSVLSLSDQEVPNPSRNFYPTCVDLKKTLVGQEAVRLLVKRLSGEIMTPQQIWIRCSLVVGNTTRQLTSDE